MERKRKLVLSTTHRILISFLTVILVGSILLVLPISSNSGESVSYIDALFTATTATCVTGLVTLPTVTTWSVFGQIVIPLLIQIGGMGTITIISAVMIAINRKMKISDYQLIQDAFNLNSFEGLSKMVKGVVRGTLLIELIGALLYMPIFIRDFGVRGIWVSVFNSISAFCNAGIDVIGERSLCDYALNPYINIITSALIILGGLGYIVWWDILRILPEIKKFGFASIKRLTLHSKIVLSSTAILIFGGGLLILLLEYNNPLTIGEYSFFDKLSVSLFQSITTRTAGFASIPQENLTDTTAIICLVLMFIGGSPVGTAGGIKTTTVVVLIATAISTFKNKNDVSLFNRSLSNQITRKAVAVSGMSIIILFISTILLSIDTNAPTIDILYETVSATATVGLTRNLTASLDILGKIIIICTMYFGRVGPISLAVAFASKREGVNIIKNPIEDISVG